MNYIEQGIKVGDKIWTIQEGDTVVNKICNCGCECITTKGDFVYQADGCYRMNDVAPSLFWSNPNIIIPPKPVKKYQWLLRSSSNNPWEITRERLTEQEFHDYRPAGIEYRKLEIE